MEDVLAVTRIIRKAAHNHRRERPTDDPRPPTRASTTRPCSGFERHRTTLAPRRGEGYVPPRSRLHDLREQPLLQRKQRLRLILPVESPHLLHVDYVPEKGQGLFDLACQRPAPRVSTERRSSSPCSSDAQARGQPGRVGGPPPPLPGYGETAFACKELKADGSPAVGLNLLAFRESVPAEPYDNYEDCEDRTREWDSRGTAGRA